MTVVVAFVFMQLLVRELKGMQKYSGTCLHNGANMQKLSFRVPCVLVYETDAKMNINCQLKV
jgi:hypothetical protein